MLERKKATRKKNTKIRVVVHINPYVMIKKPTARKICSGGRDEDGYFSFTIIFLVIFDGHWLIRSVASSYFICVSLFSVSHTKKNCIFDAVSFLALPKLSFVNL